MRKAKKRGKKRKEMRSEPVERRTVLWVMVVLYAAAIFLLSSTPKPPTDEDVGLSIPFFDKIAHFMIYFVFGYLIYRASEEEGKGPHFSYFIGSLYAFFDEIHQYFVPNRHTDPADFMVDALALFISIWICMRQKPIKGEVK